MPKIRRLALTMSSTTKGVLNAAENSTNRSEPRFEPLGPVTKTRRPNAPCGSLLQQRQRSAPKLSTDTRCTMRGAATNGGGAARQGRPSQRINQTNPPNNTGNATTTTSQHTAGQRARRTAEATPATTATAGAARPGTTNRPGSPSTVAKAARHGSAARGQMLTTKTRAATQPDNGGAARRRQPQPGLRTPSPSTLPGPTCICVKLVFGMREPRADNM